MITGGFLWPGGLLEPGVCLGVSWRVSSCPLECTPEHRSACPEVRQTACVPNMPHNASVLDALEQLPETRAASNLQPITMLQFAAPEQLSTTVLVTTHPGLFVTIKQESRSRRAPPQSDSRFAMQVPGHQSTEASTSHGPVATAATPAEPSPCLPEAHTGAAADAANCPPDADTAAQHHDSAAEAAALPPAMQAEVAALLAAAELPAGTEEQLDSTDSAESGQQGVDSVWRMGSLQSCLPLAVSTADVNEWVTCADAEGFTPNHGGAVPAPCLLYRRDLIRNTQR